AFGAMADYAGSRGVTIAFEPHVGQAVDRPERVAWLIERVGSPHFRLNLDNSHFECMGYALVDYMPAMVPLGVPTHLKDQRGRYPDHEFVVPGEGSLDFVRYLTLLDQAGYQGAVTVEISVMVQRRPGYDPAEVAARSRRVLTDAAARAPGG